MPFRRFTHALCAAALACAAVPASAQDTQSFALELNNAAETAAGACRLTYVVSNQTDTALDQTSYEVAMFDTDGVVTQIFTLQFGALTAGKTKIQQFELPDTPCGSISRILLNDVVACTTPEATQSPVCMSGLAASSRTAIQFGL